MHFRATQPITNVYGSVNFLVVPLNGDGYGRRMYSRDIEWWDTLLGDETDELEMGESDIIHRA
jgi:hypothetical protein